MAQDVTKLCAPKIANFLRNSPTVQTLDFPSLSRLIYAYHPCLYREAGRIIGEGNIEIYRTNEDGLAHYHLEGASALFLGDDINDDNRSGVIVHEVTHMIQDMSKMKLSILEMELDAYFAEALYYARRNLIEEFKKKKPMMIGICMALIAENYLDDKKYLTTNAFRKNRGEVSKEIANEYYYRAGVTNVGKRRRNDGLQL